MPLLAIVSLLLIIFEISANRIYNYQKELGLITINSIFQDYSKASNPYLLSQAIESLEKLSLIKCTKIKTEQNSNYLDLTYKSHCHDNFSILFERKTISQITAVNGVQWQLEFYPYTPKIIIILTWAMRFISLLSLLFSFKWLKKQTEKELKLQEEKNNLFVKKIKISRQIAHDIKSPLAALEMALKQISIKDTKSIKLINASMKRIHNMADNLLYEKANKRKTAVCLADLIQSAVYEKEQLAMLTEVQLIFHYQAMHRNIYCNLDTFNFLRSLSNILNNSIESFKEGTNQEKIVLINLIEEKSTITISITDTGKGISPLIIERLLKQGGSYQKINGQGLGLQQTKEFLKENNGTLEIQSQIDNGTTIKLTLPKSDSPYCLIDSISIPYQKNVLLIDNDPSILELVKQKLNLESILFIQEAENFEQIKKASIKADLIFVDYELGDKSAFVNGIDLIIKNGIQKRSILFTGNGDDPEIIKRCDENNIRLLPKAHLQYVKILCSKNQDEEETSKSPKLNILIDDDLLLRLSAENSACNIKSFCSVDAFLNSPLIGDPDIGKIFIDSELGDVKGEIESQKISLRGHKQIYLSTGHSKKSFNLGLYPWITEVISKNDLLSYVKME